MSKSIVAVVGPPGVGKTNWIGQQFNQQVPTLYFAPATRVAIDQTYLAAEFPHLQFLADGQEMQLWQFVTSGSAYLELGYQLDLAETTPLLKALDCHRVAVVPPGINSEWHDWADEIVEGVALNCTASHLWSANTTAQVIDPDSLEVFWYELTQGAYGDVCRAKGIFELADGLAVYGDFVTGLAPRDFQPLNVPRWLKGRPQRFSGIEVWGTQLDEDAIAQTFQDCCLSDAAIRYYQQQVQELLLAEVME